MDYIKNNRKNMIAFTAIAFLLLLMILLEFIRFEFLQDDVVALIVKDGFTRLFGAIIFIIVTYLLGFTYLKPQKTKWKTVLLIVPPLLVSINNFPFVAYITGLAEVTEPAQTIVLFALQCLSVGLFEEIVFRGLILVLLLERLPKTKEGIFLSILISSIIFGSSHILNLFVGAGFSATILQIGYSFLTGMMWAVVFLATKNIWFSVVLHAIYNFVGLLFYELGTITGKNDLITIVLTTVLAVIVTGYCIWLFLQIKERDIESLYTTK